MGCYSSTLFIRVDVPIRQLESIYQKENRGDKPEEKRVLALIDQWESRDSKEMRSMLFEVRSTMVLNVRVHKWYFSLQVPSRSEARQPDAVLLTTYTLASCCSEISSSRLVSEEVYDSDNGARVLSIIRRVLLIQDSKEPLGLVLKHPTILSTDLC